MGRVQVLNYFLYTGLVFSSIQAHWVPNQMYPVRHNQGFLQKRAYSGLIVSPRAPPGVTGHSKSKEKENYDRGFAALQAIFNRLKLERNSSKLGTRYPIMKRVPSEVEYYLKNEGYP